jgi:hypothetical protein
MTSNGSVYSSAIADKSVELLSVRQRVLQLAAACLTAARYLMMQG